MDPTNSLVYPWLHSTFGQLTSGSLPSGFLITGIQGLGKEQLMYQTVEQHLGISLKGTHPDVLIVAPESQYIGIDEIRQVQSFSQLTPTSATGKAVIIPDCHKMTLAAANALLKNLEEPAADTTFWLSSHSPQAVPATIRSRCRWVKISPPPHEVALEWLKTQTIEQPSFWLHLAYGAPLRALQLAGDESNKRYVREAAALFTRWLQKQTSTSALAKTLWVQPQLGSALILAFAEDALRAIGQVPDRIRFKKIAARLVANNSDFSSHWASMEQWRAFHQIVRLKPEQSSVLQLESGLMNWAARL